VETWASVSSAGGDVLRWDDWRRHRNGPVAFVLSGGGPLGAVQVGFLRALFERGIVPDMMVGVSVGALNAVAIADDPSPAGVEALQSLWLRMRKDDLFPGGRLVSAWHAVTRGPSLYSNAGLRRVIDRHLSASSFDELVIPAHVVATDLRTGDEAWFSEGPITEALLASAAMPGVLPPVVIGEGTYVDGGVVNNVPVSRAIALGARQVYVLNVHAANQPRRLIRPHDFMMHGMVLARAQRYRRDIEAFQRKATIVEFPAVDVGHVPFTSTVHTARLVDAGYCTASELLRAGASAEQPQGGGRMHRPA
jgi:NTE family protein